jgi:hypothetical protein
MCRPATVAIFQVVFSFSLWAYQIEIFFDLPLFLSLAWGLPSALFLLGVAKVTCTSSYSSVTLVLII